MSVYNVMPTNTAPFYLMSSSCMYTHRRTNIGDSACDVRVHVRVCVRVCVSVFEIVFERVSVHVCAHICACLYVHLLMCVYLLCFDVADTRLFCWCRTLFSTREGQRGGMTGLDEVFKSSVRHEVSALTSR